MSSKSTTIPAWLSEWMETRKIPLWGAADLTSFSTPADEHGNGSWVRLGTVFTDMDLPCGPPKKRSHCGKCRLCVETCPAGALTGQAWYPGIPRKEILDVRRCDQWKKDHYFEYHQGHNCGICSAVCPYGIKKSGLSLD